MRKSISIFLLSFALLVLLTGCWSRRELNEIAIATAIGIDWADGQYVVTAQVVNPNEIATGERSSGGTGAPVAVFTERSATIFDAMRRMTSKSPRKVYLAHLRVLVIGEELAEEGIVDGLDFLSRDPETRADFPVAVAKGVSAETILRVYSIPLEAIPANRLLKSMEDTSQWLSSGGDVSLDQLISEIKSEGKNPVLLSVGISGEKDVEVIQSRNNIQGIKPKAILQIQGMAAFKHDKMVGWLSLEESIGLHYVLGRIKSTVRTVSCPDGGKLALETIRSKTTMKGSVVNGRPQIEIKVSSEENVADAQCNIDLMKESSIWELEEREEKGIRSSMEAVVHKAQKEFKSDIFGFGEAVHRGDPADWKRLKEEWDQVFPDTKVQIRVDVKIRRLGTQTQPTQRKPT